MHFRFHLFRVSPSRSKTKTKMNPQWNIDNDQHFSQFNSKNQKKNHQHTPKIEADSKPDMHFRYHIISQTTPNKKWEKNNQRVEEEREDARLERYLKEMQIPKPDMHFRYDLFHADNWTPLGPRRRPTSIYTSGLRVGPTLISMSSQLPLLPPPPPASFHFRFNVPDG